MPTITISHFLNKFLLSKPFQEQLLLRQDFLCSLLALPGCRSRQFAALSDTIPSLFRETSSSFSTLNTCRNIMLQNQKRKKFKFLGTTISRKLKVSFQCARFPEKCFMSTVLTKQCLQLRVQFQTSASSQSFITYHSWIHHVQKKMVKGGR